MSLQSCISLFRFVDFQNDDCFSYVLKISCEPKNIQIGTRKALVQISATLEVRLNKNIPKC
jgi:hypothetical protein